MFYTPDLPPEGSINPQAIFEGCKAVFFFPLAVMAAVVGGCFAYPLNLLVMLGVLLGCCLIAWAFFLRQPRAAARVSVPALDPKRLQYAVRPRAH